MMANDALTPFPNASKMAFDVLDVVQSSWIEISHLTIASNPMKS